MTTTKIPFGSAQYFDLLAQHPEWYKYVAVGEQVIFVVNGDTSSRSPLDVPGRDDVSVAYEITALSS